KKLPATSRQLPAHGFQSTDNWKLDAGNRKLSRFFDQRNGLFLGLHDLAGDDALADLLLAGEVVHQVEHQIFDDHPQAACANLARQGRLGDRLERIVGEAQLHVFVLEQLLVLTRDGVPRLRQDLNQGRLVEFVQRANDRQAADELRNQTVLDEILWLEHLERRPDVAVRDGLDVGFEAQRFLSRPSVDLFVEADERAAADEQDVGGVDLEEFLMGVFPSALRWNVRHGPFEDLQERLLHALARDIA